MLLHAHSGLRYLVLLAGVAALAYALFGLVTRRPYDRRMRLLATLFAGTLHLQVLLGLALLFTRTFYPQLAGHVLMMVFAAVVAQIVPSVMRRRAPEQRSWAPHAVNVTLALVLVAGGILAIGRPILGSGITG